MTANWVDGATPVLVGSIASDASCWDFVGVPPHAIRVEYPGHGSRARQPGWNHEALVDEIAAGVDGPIDVIGVALGAAIAVTLIQHHPGRVRSAMLITGSPPVDADSLVLERRRATAEANADLPQHGGMAVVPDAVLPRWFTPWAVRTDQPGVRYARERLLALDAQAWYDIWMAGPASPSLSSDELRRFTGPVTLVGGTNDFAEGLQGLAELHRIFPNSRFEIMPVSHMAQLEHPEFVSAAIDRHSAWLPVGQRVEATIGSSAWPPAEELFEGRRVAR